MLLGQALQLEDSAAADERLVDFKVGIFGGGANEGNRSVLYPRQQRVLLCFVEAMHLIDEEDSPLIVQRPAFLGVGHRCANLFDAG